MIIDIHGHYTTEPPVLHQFREKQVAGLADPMRRPTSIDPGISDEMLVQSVQPQLKFQSDRGTDVTGPAAVGLQPPRQLQRQDRRKDAQNVR